MRAFFVTAVLEKSPTDAQNAPSLVAFRCLYVGQTYALVDKYPEALSLFQRASLYIRQLRSSSVLLADLSEATPETPAAAKHHRGVTTLLIPDAAVASLEEQLGAAEHRARKDWFLFQHASTSAVATAERGAIADDEQDEGQGLDSAVKSLALNGQQSGAQRSKKRTGPLFFDVAFNYVAGIDLDVLDRAAKGDPLGAASSSSAAEVAPEAMQVDKAEQSGESVVHTVQKTLERTATQLAQKAEQAATSVNAALPEAKQEPALKQQQPPSGSRFWGLFGGGKK